MREQVNAIKLPSKTVFMRDGNREILMQLAYKLRQEDLHLIAPESLDVRLVVERQWADLATLEEFRIGDVVYWIGPRQFADD